MKKKSLQLLKLNKKSISNLSESLLKGGNGTLYGCRWTENSWCDCPTERDCTDTECHTVWDCEL